MDNNISYRLIIDCEDEKQAKLRRAYIKHILNYHAKIEEYNKDAVAI